MLEEDVKKTFRSVPVKSLEFVKQLLSSLIPWISRQIPRKKISTRAQYKMGITNLIIIDT